MMFFVWLIVAYVCIMFFYSFTSQIAFFRTVLMLAAAVVVTIYGFSNANVSYEIFTLAWWQTEGVIWVASSVFFMYVVADFAWEPHYYDEYRFVDHFFGAPEVSVREVEEYHPIRWILLSCILGAGVVGAGTFLQNVLVKHTGYLMHGFLGLIYILVYVIIVVRKIVKSARGY